MMRLAGEVEHLTPAERDAIFKHHEELGHFGHSRGVFCECLTRSSKIQHHEARLLELPADPKDLEF
jgi:hypothetical protein